MKTFGYTICDERLVQAAVGRDLPPMPPQFPALFAGVDKVCLVTASDAPASLRARAVALFPEGREPHSFYWLPPSEKAKTLNEAARFCTFLFSRGFSRSSLIVAAGGGTVTDLAGFAASMYMRGIKWVSVPTSFLGQIDAGLGGKTAVNLGGAKNMLGTFYQPVLSVCDTAFLDSLPHAELRSGAGELVKYAMIAPAGLRRAITRNLSHALAGDKSALTSCVAACAEFKLAVVAGDERDLRGMRETLNFGHTAGHAFEAMAEGRLPHGEAVARGMRFALILSLNAGLLKASDFAKMNALVDALRLPPAKVRADFRRFLKLVSMDKKARGAENRFILLRAPGRTAPARDIKGSLLKPAFDGALK